MREVRSLARATLEAVAANATARRVVETPRLNHEVVSRYIAGETEESLLVTCSALQTMGRAAAVTRLVPLPTDAGEIRERARDYRELVDALADAGLAAHGGAEISFRLADLGRYVDREVSEAELRETVAHARGRGVRVTLESDRVGDVDDLLAVAEDLRGIDPGLTVALQAAHRRTESDCAHLADASVRLSTGGADPDDPACHSRRHDVDKAYVRCLKILLHGPGYPVVATSDLPLQRIAQSLAHHVDRPSDSYEYLLRHGVRPITQTVIADRGDRLRVYLPYGDDWYPYLVGRIAEQPSNLAAMLRAAVGR